MKKMLLALLAVVALSSTLEVGAWGWCRKGCGDKEACSTKRECGTRHRSSCERPCKEKSCEKYDCNSCHGCK